jgi:RNA polymerase sigma-70 factor, ECF subfamily
MERSERKLIDACRGGDRDAFGCLFEIYSKKIFSIALRFSRDTSDAMDVAQDTFLKLFCSIRDFRGESSFDAWVYRLVVNGCLDHHRRAHRLVPMADEFVDTLRAPADSGSDLLRAELRNRLGSAVGCLSPDLRMVVALRYGGDLSYDEIAAALGCAPGTVASRLNRAHRKLHRCLAHLVSQKQDFRDATSHRRSNDKRSCTDRPGGVIVAERTSGVPTSLG